MSNNFEYNLAHVYQLQVELWSQDKDIDHCIDLSSNRIQFSRKKSPQSWWTFLHLLWWSAYLFRQLRLEGLQDTSFNKVWKWSTSLSYLISSVTPLAAQCIPRQLDPNYRVLSYQKLMLTCSVVPSIKRTCLTASLYPWSAWQMANMAFVCLCVPSCLTCLPELCDFQWSDCACHCWGSRTGCGNDPAGECLGSSQPSWPSEDVPPPQTRSLLGLMLTGST